MVETTAPTRRTLLACSTGLLASLAGCGGADDSANSDDTNPQTDSDDLDLREANVVGVDVERDGGSVTFDVTLHHNDDGEDGYANWWQVETLSGEQLGRRDLAHPHSTQPFTRSDTFEIASDVSCVVVRGHDQTHGYGGQAMVVTLGTGATRRVSQGGERQSVESGSCP